VFIQDLLKALADAQIPYCIVGGVAVNLHGVPRMTYDVDLVVETTADVLQRVDAVLVASGLQCRLPIRLVDLADARLRDEYRLERNLIAVTYTDPRDPLREVDILVSPPVAPNELVARAITLDLDGVPVRVISIDDLIELKRETGRDQDAADITHLERIRGVRG
jgi:predicted nucleotidyltransferase